MKRKFPKLNLDVLKLRDFRLLLTVRALTFMALQAQAVIVGWQIYSITKSPLMLGLAGLAEALPALTFAIVAGYIVDRSRTQLVFLICVGILALNALALLMIGGGYIEVPQLVVLIWLYAGVAISGIARAFIMPSHFTLLPLIVPRSLFSAAAGWMSTTLQVGAVSGPAIAGLIYDGHGAHVAWWIPAGLLFVSVIMLSAMSDVVKSHRGERRSETAIKSIKEGWHFILKNPIVLSVMALDMFAVLFGGAVAMLPAYVDQVLQMGSEGLGLLRAAPALGSAIIGLWLALVPLQVLRGPVLLATVAGFGLSMVGFGLSTTFAFAMFFLMLSGGFDNVSLVMRATILQITTPASMRGRVSGINSMFIISSNEIGAFESGVAARLLGLVPSIVFGGFATLIVVAATAWLSPQLWRMKLEASEPEKA